MVTPDPLRGELRREILRRVVERQNRPRYTLKELLARCDPKVPRTEEEREWLDSPPVGGELL